MPGKLTKALKRASERLHAREILFHAFAINGVNYLAVRNDAGVVIVDDGFNSYGAFESLESFVRRQQSSHPDEPVSSVQRVSFVNR